MNSVLGNWKKSLRQMLYPDSIRIPLDRLIRRTPESEESSFSVIMPTLWRVPKITLRSMELLCRNEHIGEIVVISNGPTNLTFSSPKVRILQQEENIYVNPAWNLGAREARFPNLMILNDDGLLADEAVTFMAGIAMEHYGVIGLSEQSILDWEENKPMHPQRTGIAISKRMNFGFGGCLFLHKSRYIEIPNDLKIYYGDSFLYDKNRQLGNVNLVLNTQLQTINHSTSGEPQFSPIKEADRKLFLDLMGYGK